MSVLFNRYRWVGLFPRWYLLRFINNAVAYSTVYSDSSTSGRLLSVCSRRMPAIQAMRSFENGGGKSQAQQGGIEGKQCCVARNNSWCHQTIICWRGSANVFFGSRIFFVFVFLELTLSPSYPLRSWLFALLAEDWIFATRPMRSVERRNRFLQTATRPPTFEWGWCAEKRSNKQVSIERSRQP